MSSPSRSFSELGLQSSPPRPSPQQSQQPHIQQVQQYQAPNAAAVERLRKQIAHTDQIIRIFENDAGPLKRKRTKLTKKQALRLRRQEETIRAKIAEKATYEAQLAVALGTPAPVLAAPAAFVSPLFKSEAKYETVEDVKPFAVASGSGIGRLDLNISGPSPLVKPEMDMDTKPFAASSDGEGDDHDAALGRVARKIQKRGGK